MGVLHISDGLILNRTVSLIDAQVRRLEVLMHLEATVPREKNAAFDTVLAEEFARERKRLDDLLKTCETDLFQISMQQIRENYLKEET